MHFWWQFKSSLSVMYFKKAMLLTVTEAAAAGVWLFFRMRYLRSRGNEKQEIAWRKDSTVTSLPPLSLLSLNKFAAKSISSQGKSQSYDLFSSNYMTYLSPSPTKGVFLPFTHMCLGNRDMCWKAVPQWDVLSTSALADLTVNFNRAS